MVNINIEMDDNLHKEMKIKCVSSSVTIQDHINNLIREDLKRKK